MSVWPHKELTALMVHAGREPGGRCQVPKRVHADALERGTLGSTRSERLFQARGTGLPISRAWRTPGVLHVCGPRSRGVCDHWTSVFACRLLGTRHRLHRQPAMLRILIGRHKE